MVKKINKKEEIIKKDQKKTDVKTAVAKKITAKKALEKKAVEVKQEKPKVKKKISIITKNKPEKRLTKKLKKRAGRNSGGSITVRHRGGGAKRLYRIIDFKRNTYDSEAEVLAIEYDPNRSAYIALIQYKKNNNEKRYILAPQKLKVGDKVINSQKKIRANIGSRMPLEHIPLGTMVHDVELIFGRGGQIVRSAGTYAILLSRDAGFTHLKMPSGEIRMFKDECRATVGQLSNISHNREVIGKAGRKRHMGIRPTVRGKAMNPVDHPHGGGEGRQPIGLKHPKTPWGAPALGYKTRKRKASDKLIIKRRKGK